MKKFTKIIILAFCFQGIMSMESKDTEKYITCFDYFEDDDDKPKEKNDPGLILKLEYRPEQIEILQKIKKLEEEEALQAAIPKPREHDAVSSSTHGSIALTVYTQTSTTATIGFQQSQLGDQGMTPLQKQRLEQHILISKPK